MLETLDFKENDKILSRIGGKNGDMLMDITVRHAVIGHSFELFDNEKETAIVLLSGTVFLGWEGKTAEVTRKNPFEALPYVLHVCKGVTVDIIPVTDCDLIILKTENERVFDDKLYTPSDCIFQQAGDTQWEGTAKREIVTVFDYTIAPYSNLVVGEVFTLPGRWSSYPPHSHPQPEVYYYLFDKPQGFGSCIIGDDAFKIKNGSYAAIPGGLVHPQTTAPGYKMYYCWMIRHLDGNPWTDRIYEDAHKWLLDG